MTSYKTMHKVRCIALLLVLCRLPVDLSAQEYNVRDFGAKGDGKTDDTPAFRACAEQLTATGGTLLIPYGQYRLSAMIHINYDGPKTVTVRGIPENGRLPELQAAGLHDLLQINGWVRNPQGAVVVSRLSFRGVNRPYTRGHAYYNRPAYQTALRIMDRQRVTVTGCRVRDIYGTGLFIGSSDPFHTPLSLRMREVRVLDNHIENTWGAHLPGPGKAVYDNYGDGIYISNAAGGLVTGNTVVNNLQQTKQFGRAGIVLEYDTENFTVEKNTVSGYDRNIHAEACIGNITIRDNDLSGSDFGILVFNTCRHGPLRPLRIERNRISNSGIPSLPGLVTIRHPTERSLVYIGNHGDCTQAITIRNNRLEVDAASALVNSRVLYLPQGVLPGQNTYVLPDVRTGRRPVNQLGTRRQPLQN